MLREDLLLYFSLTVFFFLSIPAQYKFHLFRFNLLGIHLNSIALNEVTFDYL